MSGSNPERRRDARPALLLAGLVLVAVNLRPALASISPVLEAVREDLGLGRAAAGLLTTIPTLCMGAFAFVSALVSERLGTERAVLWAVVLVGVATVARVAAGDAGVLYASTLAVGVGIAVGQALLPAVVKKHFAERAALVTGLYTVGFNAGAALAAGATVALAGAFGDSWAAGLGSWGLLAVPAAVVWVSATRAITISPAARPEGSATGAAERSRPGLPWRSPRAWLLGVFFASSSCLYLSVLIWLAPLYQDRGMGEGRTGLLLTYFTLVQIAGALVVSALADRARDRRPWLALTLVVTAAGLLAVALVPLASPWGFTALLGFGIGGLFPLALTLPLDYAADPAAAGRLTAMTLGVGYLLAAAGPFGVGALRDATGSYAVVAEHRARAPWYLSKANPSTADMLAKLRRVIIAAQYHPGAARTPTPAEITRVQHAWAAAGL